MDLALFWAWLVALLKANIGYAEPLVFALALAEGIPGLSFLVPSTALFLVIGGLHSAAGGELWHVAAAGTAGALVGDILAYAAGFYLRNDVAKLRYFAVHPKAIEQGHVVFARWGIFAVVAGKFLGFARPFIPVVAGITTMPVPLFLAASAVSSAAWATAFLSPGYGFKFIFT